MQISAFNNLVPRVFYLQAEERNQETTNRGGSAITAYAKYFSKIADTSNSLKKKHVIMQRLISKAVNVQSFTRIFFCTQTYGYSVFIRMDQ